MAKLTTPTVHLNGTSKADLLAPYEQAYRALGDAIEAVQKTGPNGRDYYVQGPGVINLASTEHGFRLKRLQAVRDEILEIFQAIDEQ
jgi:hypothetical protein